MYSLSNKHICHSKPALWALDSNVSEVSAHTQHAWRSAITCLRPIAPKIRTEIASTSGTSAFDPSPGAAWRSSSYSSMSSIVFPPAMMQMKW